MQRNSSLLAVVFKLDEYAETAGGIFHNKDNDTNLFLDGSGYPVFYDIKDSLNLSVEMHFTPSWTHAWQLVANGTFEMGGLLVTHEPSLIPYGLGSTVAFLHPLISLTSDVFFRQPPIENIRITIFRPFQYQVWICLIGFMMFSALALILMQAMACQLSKKDWSFTNFSTVLLNTVQFLIGRCQDEDIPPQTVSAEHQEFHFLRLHVTVGVAIYLSTFANMLYTAKIAAMFLNKDVAVKSPYDLLQFQYTLSSYSAVHVHRLFTDTSKLSRDPETTAVNNMRDNVVQKVVSPNETDPRQALLSHIDGFFVYGTLSYNYSKEMCAVSVLTSNRRSPRSMYIRKDSKFREIFNLKILESIQRGLNFRYQKIYMRKFEFNCAKETHSFEPLSYKHVSFAYMFLLLGACASAIVELIIFLRYKLITRSLR